MIFKISYDLTFKTVLPGIREKVVRELTAF